MPTAHYYEQSFYVPAWQNIVDVNAPLIEIPENLLSPGLGGFAFENVDGTYTVWLGEDVALGGPDGIVSGTVQAVFRLSSLDNLDLENTIARVSGSYNAIDVYNAYRSGGDAFLLTLFGGDVHFEIDSPASLGPLGQSPLIETYYGDDVVFGSIYADTIIAGQGDDEVRGGRGNDTIYGYSGGDHLYGGRGHDNIFGGAGDDALNGGAGGDTLEGGAGSDVLWGDDGADVIRGGASAGSIDIDILDGGDGDDLLYGDDGTDYIVAGRGDDVIINDHGNDRVHGDAGFDTVGYYRPLADYHVEFVDNAVVVTDLVGDGGADILYDVEWIVFTDGSIFV
jgi:Ca2+-binding RTX toxin-like protein